MFRRRQSEKRGRQIAVRVTDEEYAALESCAAILARREGGKFLVSDVLREALALLHETLHTPKPGAKNQPTRPPQVATETKKKR